MSNDGDLVLELVVDNIVLHNPSWRVQRGKDNAHLTRAGGVRKCCSQTVGSALWKS